jgi:hypothetical protein
MSAKKFIRNIAGRLTEVLGIVVSAGAGNDGDIPALDASGKLDISLMPSGIGASTISATATETISAGDWVNLWLNGGILSVRKADATTNAKPCNGYAVAGITSAASGTIYLGGQNSGVTGRTIGAMQYLSTTPGASVETAPSGSGNLVQQLGPALAATQVRMNIQEICTNA